MRPFLTIILVALTLAVGATSASADGTWTAASGWSYPTERVANNALLNSINASALTFWNRRGIYPSTHVTYLLVDTFRDLAGPDAPNGAIGRGDKADARLWLTAVEVEHAQAPNARAECLFLYGVITHELGHVAGLPHSATGVMSPAGGIPGDAAVWYRQRVAALRASHHRHHPHGHHNTLEGRTR